MHTGSCKSIPSITYVCQGCWCTPVTPTLGRWRREGQKFSAILSESKASLLYLKPCLKTKRMGGGAKERRDHGLGRLESKGETVVKLGSVPQPFTVTLIQLVLSPNMKKPKHMHLFLRTKENI